MKHPPPDDGAIRAGEPPIAPRPKPVPPANALFYRIVKYVVLAFVLGIVLFNAAFFGYVLFLAFFVRIH